MTLAAAALAALLAMAPAPPDPDLEAFFSRWGLTAAERRSVQDGDVVARMLEVGDPKDIGCQVALRLEVSRERLLRWLTGPDGRRGESILAAGEIRGAGDMGDVEALVVAPRQAEDLRDCRPGDCGMKLSAAAISELQALRGPSGRVSSEAASRVLRDLLLRAAEAYRRDGPAGLVTYADRPRPVSVRDALEALKAPRPERGSPGRFLWSQEKLWKRIVITLDHEVVEERPPSDAVLLSTRLYANHYFEGAFTVTALHETAGGCYVVFVHRSRSDHRRGFSGLERGLVNLLVRRRLRGQWEDVRHRLESSRRATQ